MVRLDFSHFFCLSAARGYLRMVFIAVSLFSVMICRGQFVLSGDFDARGEYMNLHRVVADSLKNKTFNLLGTAELDAEYQYKKFTAYLAMQGAYNSGTSLYSSQRSRTWSANVSEAWAKYGISKNFSLQAGRIEISYEDEQFFQARSLDNLIVSHNAVIGHWYNTDTSFMTDLGFAANRFPGAGADLNTNPAVNNYRYMGYLYAHREMFDEKFFLTVSDIFNASDNGVDMQNLYGRNTVGFSSWVVASDWNFFAALYYQHGHITDGRRLSAFYNNICITFEATDWLTLVAANEHMTGDNLADTAEWKHVAHGFSMLYGNTKKTMGLSGIFNLSARSNVSPGLNNLYGKAVVDFSESLSLEATYHWFTVPNAYMVSADPVTAKPSLTKVSSSLMHEADLLLTWDPLETLEITLGYALIIPGKSIQEINGWNFRGNHFISTGNLEIDFSPVLWKSKKELKR